jgi:hypothetical protein
MLIHYGHSACIYSYKCNFMGHTRRHRNKWKSAASQHLIIHTEQHWQMKLYFNNIVISFIGMQIISTNRICSAVKNTGEETPWCAHDSVQNTWAWKKYDLHSCPKMLPNCVGFQVLTVVVVMNYVLWHITRCIRTCLLPASCWFLSWIILGHWRSRRYVLRNVGWISTDCIAIYPRRQNFPFLLSVYYYMSSLPGSDSGTTEWLFVILLR